MPAGDAVSTKVFGLIPARFPRAHGIRLLRRGRLGTSDGRKRYARLKPASGTRPVGRIRHFPSRTTLCFSRAAQPIRLETPAMHLLFSPAQNTFSNPDMTQLIAITLESLLD